MAKTTKQKAAAREQYSALQQERRAADVSAAKNVFKGLALAATIVVTVFGALFLTIKKPI